MTGADTRRAIAEAAAQEFLLHGYAGTSLSTVAERLGLTKGALAYHFPTKADFASHFIRAVRAATAQADAHSKSEYPTCGARRLLLYFMMMGSWHTSVPCYAAGMALFTDSASPTFEADEVIKDWLTLSVEALETARESGPGLSTLEAAEVFLVTNLGAAFFGRHVRLNMPGTQKLRFVRAGVTAAGVSHVDQYAHDVLGKHDGRLPAFDYSRIDDH